MLNWNRYQKGKFASLMTHDTSIKLAVNPLSNDLRRSFLGRYLGHSSRQAGQAGETGDVYENAAAICEVKL